MPLTEHTHVVPMGPVVWFPIIIIMGTCMKTTIEIQDDLMKAATAFAREQGTTLRSIVERGIRATLKEEQRSSRYELADFQQATWTDIRDAVYREHGS